MLTKAAPLISYADQNRKQVLTGLGLFLLGTLFGYFLGSPSGQSTAINEKDFADLKQQVEDLKREMQSRKAAPLPAVEIPSEEDEILKELTDNTGSKDEQVRIQNKAKDTVNAYMLVPDPQSTQFEILKTAFDVKVPGETVSEYFSADVVCGRANIKQAGGQYSGYQEFIWISAGNKLVMKPNVTNTHINDPYFNILWVSVCDQRPILENTAAKSTATNPASTSSMFDDLIIQPSSASATKETSLPAAVSNK